MVYEKGELRSLPDHVKIIIEKEYQTLHKNKPSIGLVMMLRNEEKRIHVSLNSIVGYIQALIIYDTGSTDRTIDIIKEFCEKHQINLYLIQGTFVNFCDSRNVLLDYCDRFNVHYLLLLDCNDELQGGDALKNLAKNYYEKDNSGFLLCQKWWSGCLDKYYNVRLVKNRCGWRYFGSVHEWIKDTTKEREDPNPAFPIIRIEDEIVIYQDRTKDDDKSSKRFARDRLLLLEEYKKDPTEPRTVFYLSQTCECLSLHDESYYYAKLRTELKGFDEEIFHAYMRCGASASALNHEWVDVMGWYIKAYEFCNRAEPLIRIVDHYRKKGLWYMAYMFAHQACGLIYPSHLILFIDSGMYDYYRWHVMGEIAIHVGQYEEGRQACVKALAKQFNKAVDQANLEKYLEKLKEPQNIPTSLYGGPPLPPSVLSLPKKAIFIEKIVEELKAKYPKLPLKSIQSRANKIWKEEKSKKVSFNK